MSASQRTADELAYSQVDQGRQAIVDNQADLGVVGSEHVAESQHEHLRKKINQLHETISLIRIREGKQNVQPEYCRDNDSRSGDNTRRDGSAFTSATPTARRLISVWGRTRKTFSRILGVLVVRIGLSRISRILVVGHGARV
jgi:hypothetical protein